MMELFLPSARAEPQGVQGPTGTRAAPALATSNTAVGGRSDKLVTGWELRAWAEHTTGEFSARMFDGGHVYLREAEFVEVLGWLLEDELTRQRTGTG